jgi:hypothetical protein
LPGTRRWDFAHIRDLPASFVETKRERTSYEILGIANNAGEKQIRAAYRELSQRYENAAEDEDGAKDALREIQAAFETLSDSRKRAAYDRRLFIAGRQAARKSARGRTIDSRLVKLGSRFTLAQLNFSITGVLVFLVCVGPFVVFKNPEVSAEQTPTGRRGEPGTYAPAAAWVNSLTWLEENSPEPFGDADAYYDNYDLPAAGQSFEYPGTAYGVLSWWDYGYWITRIGHRIPVANPSQESETLTGVGTYFTAGDEDEANEIIDSFGAEYVIVDNDMAYTDPYDFSGKFYAMATWAGDNRTDYFDLYYFRDGDYYRGELRYHLDYYKSMAPGSISTTAWKSPRKTRPCSITWSGRRKTAVSSISSRTNGCSTATRKLRPSSTNRRAGHSALSAAV